MGACKRMRAAPDLARHCLLNLLCSPHLKSKDLEPPESVLPGVLPITPVGTGVVGKLSHAAVAACAGVRGMPIADRDQTRQGSVQGDLAYKK